MLKLVILAVLGFVFPLQLINAIRSEDMDKADNAKMLSCLCFSAIVVLIGCL